jgi:hypothetical protein
VLSNHNIIVGFPLVKSFLSKNRIYLLHFRNLYDFFSISRKYPTDILASDFGFIKLNLKPEDDLKKSINKRLAHITSERLNNDLHGKEWNVGILNDILLPICISFCTFIINNFANQFDEDERLKWNKLLILLKGVLPSERNTIKLATYDVPIISGESIT